MASSSMDLMWKIMNKYKLKMVENSDQFHCIICKNIMINSYISTCGCQFCKECLDRILESGTISCPGGQEDCKLQTFVLNEDILSDNRANIKISKLKAVCPNSDCLCEVELGKMSEHLRLCEMVDQECPYFKLGCELKCPLNWDLSTHMETEDVLHAQLLIKVVENLRNDIKDIQEKLKQEELKNEEHLEEFQKNKDLIEKLQKDFLNLTQHPQDRILPELEEDVAGESTGEMLWKIDNYYEKTQRALDPKEIYQRSQPFLSHPQGYKLCLILYPNGCAVGKGTHLYIGFNIMKGKFDNELPWPFRGSVNISIVDQLSNMDKFQRKYTYESIPEKTRYLLDKPKTTYNHGWGDLKLVEFSELYGTSSLLLEDSLLVRCVVEPFIE